MEWLIWIVLSTIVLYICMFYRNYQVAKQRMQFLDEISVLAIHDINNERECRHWYLFWDNGISYNEMFFKFWIPLSHYDDLFKQGVKMEKLNTIKPQH